MKKKSKIILILIIVVLIAFIFIWGAIELNKIDNASKNYENLYFGVTKDQSVAYLAYNPNDEINTQIINNEYFCIKKEYEEGNNLIPEPEDVSDYSSTTYYFYSLESGELLYEYNLGDFYQKHSTEFLFENSNLGWIDYEQGQPIYIRYSDESRELYINVETGESFTKEKERPEQRDDSEIGINSSEFLGKKTGTNLFENNGLSNVEVDIENNYCTINATDLPEENAALYEMFPELKEIRAREDMCVQLYFDELEIDRLLELFTENSKVDYEGCVVYAHSSVDGKEHVVNNKEEFDLYYEEIEYEQVVENHKREAKGGEDYLPPSIRVEVSQRDGYWISVYSYDNYTDSRVTVKVNGKLIRAEESTYVSVKESTSEIPHRIEVTASDKNGNSQTRKITDITVTGQSDEEESTEAPQEGKAKLTKVKVIGIAYIAILGVLIITLIVSIVIINKEESII